MERLRRAVRVGVEWCHSCGPRIFAEEPHERAQRARHGLYVRVQQEDELPYGSRVGLVHGRGEAEVGRVSDQLDPVTVEGIGRAVHRAVVDDDHLAGEAVVDTDRKRVETLEHEVARVPVDDEDRDVDIGHPHAAPKDGSRTPISLPELDGGRFQPDHAGSITQPLPPSSSCSAMASLALHPLPHGVASAMLT